jgi:hypothetical protein
MAPARLTAPLLPWDRGGNGYASHRAGTPNHAEVDAMSVRNRSLLSHPGQPEQGDPGRESAAGADRLQELDLASLRALRTELTDYETRVSYWRRLLQARLDLLAAGRQGHDLQQLARALADAPSRSRRMANLAVLPPDQVPPLPDVAHLWQEVPPPGSDTTEYEARLRDMERQLSELRQGLHQSIDSAHRALIERYRADPSLALTILPRD